MIRPTDLDMTLQRAFGLAFFLHGEREVALRIVAAALEKLEVAASAQHKRFYYRLAGVRNRVSLSEPHLLQRLIFIESEPFERQKEERAGADREDLLVHYLKHLIRITLKRNSFYVTLGLCRLLFNYTTPETMDVYQAIIQDPERVKNDYYYRSRKATLLQEIKERFGSLVRAGRAAHGEERLEPDEDQQGLAGLAAECLGLFTPWNTTCPVPARWSRFAEALPALTSAASRGEDEVEIHRIHAVLHPDCFRRLTAALGLDAPEDRLRIPRFFVSGGTGSGDRRNPPPLGEEDLRRIKGRLVEQSERRRRASGELLRVLVDGEERARLDVQEAGEASFALGRGAELIEVRGRDEQGELLLATYLIRSGKASITLEGGREITFSITLTDDLDGGTVEVRHRPAGPAARNALAWLFRGWSSPGLAPALALLLLLLCAAGALLLLQRKEPVEVRGPVIASPRRAEPPAPRPPERERRPIAPPPEEIAAHTPAPHVPEAEDDVLRSMEGPAGIASLAEASTICVEAVGEEAAGRDLARDLARRLGEGSRLRVTEDVEEADACLKFTVERVGEGGTLRVKARLVNADGRVLWPAGSAEGGVYEGSAEEVTAGIAGDLLAGT